MMVDHSRKGGYKRKHGLFVDNYLVSIECRSHAIAVAP